MRRFKWDKWDFDCEGDAYIISKDVCPEKSDVPDFICKEDCIHFDCKKDMNVQEGWCSWQVRSDWENIDYSTAGYVVNIGKNKPKTKNKWFPVWIIRCEEWY